MQTLLLGMETPPSSPDSAPMSPGIKFRTQLVAAKKTAQERQHLAAQTRQRFTMELEARTNDAERALKECEAELAAAHNRISELEAALGAKRSTSPDSISRDRSQSLDGGLTSISPEPPGYAAGEETHALETLEEELLHAQQSLMLDKTKREAMEEERLSLRTQQLADPLESNVASTGVHVESSSSGGMKVTLRSSRRSLGPSGIPADSSVDPQMVGHPVTNPICAEDWRARCEELQGRVAVLEETNRILLAKQGAEKPKTKRSFKWNPFQRCMSERSYNE